MPIPANQIINIEATVIGTAAAGGVGSRQFQAVLHWRRTSTVPSFTKASFDTAFQAAISVPLIAALNSRYTQSSNTIRILNDALDAPVPFSHAVVGGVAGDGMAMHNAGFLLWRTGLRGRSYKGGMHIGPLSEADTTTPNPDVFNAGALANLAAVVAAVVGGFTDSNGNSWVPTVVSKKQSQLRVNPTLVVSNDINLGLVNRRVGRMKHREVKSLY